MKTSRAAVFAGGSAALVATGFATAPTELPTLDLVAPTGTQDQGEFTGPAVSNSKGVYQAQIVVADGVVTDVLFLQAGSPAANSVDVNAMALPILRERVLAAQDWNVDHVSGASFTSPAIIESIQAAFADAGLD